MTEIQKACCLEIPVPFWRERIAKRLRSHRMSHLPVLNTCQRLETYGWQPAMPLPIDIKVTPIEEGQSIRRLARTENPQAT